MNHESWAVLNVFDLAQAGTFAARRPPFKPLLIGSKSIPAGHNHVPFLIGAQTLMEGLKCDTFDQGGMSQPPAAGQGFRIARH
jgi:hypothetical protein